MKTLSMPKLGMSLKDEVKELRSQLAALDRELTEACEIIRDITDEELYVVGRGLAFRKGIRFLTRHARARKETT